MFVGGQKVICELEKWEQRERDGGKRERGRISGEEFKVEPKEERLCEACRRS